MIKRTEIGALEKNMLQMIKNFGNRKANNQKNILLEITNSL